MVTSTIPFFSLMYIVQVWEYYLHSQDIETLQYCFPVAEQIIKTFTSLLTEKGLIHNLEKENCFWNFYEWQPGLNGVERHYDKVVYEAPFNAFVTDTFRCFAEICKLVRPELAAKYYSLHEKVNRATHTAFWDEKAGAYLTRLGDEKPKHVLTQGLMLYVDAVPEQYKGQVIKNILQGDMITYSLSMSIYVYEALVK